jgi:hypothetical protein
MPVLDMNEIELSKFNLVYNYDTFISYSRVLIMEEVVIQPEIVSKNNWLPLKKQNMVRLLFKQYVKQLFQT